MKKIVLLLLAAIALTLTVATPANALSKCGRAVINDWYDGRIDRAYPAKCYRKALKELPEDVEVYSSARDDIRRAFLAAIRNNKGKPLKPNQLVPPPKYPGRPRGDAVAAPEDGDDQGVFGAIFDAVRPSNADSIPLPLLVLAGLAFVLLGSAAAGVIARRVQARRAGFTRPADDPPIP